MQRARTTRRQDMLTALFGLWMVVGGGIDGWAHRTYGLQIETFFTPWHAALYSGFAATALWMAWVARDYLRTRDERKLPVGYGLGLVGALVFGAGGAADMAWHTIFGIEVDLEALLSPTHVLLFVGAMLVLTTPLRAAWGSSRPSREPGFGDFLPILVSVELVLVEALFFFQYLHPILGPLPARFASWQFGPPPQDGGFVLGVIAIASFLVTNAILMGLVVLVLSRWRPPFGSLTALLGVMALLVASLEDFERLHYVTAFALGGLAGDVLVAALRGSDERPVAFWVTAGAIPAVTWSAFLGIAHVVDGGLVWAAELTSGTVAFATLTGVGLAILAVRPSPRASGAPSDGAREPLAAEPVPAVPAAG